MSNPPPLKSGARGSFTLSLRIARRDALAHRGRSALIILLIAIPIIGLSGLSVVLTSNEPTPQEALRNSLGSNQAVLTVVGRPDSGIRQDPINPGNYDTGQSEDTTSAPPTRLPSAYLPAGTRVIPLRTLAVIANTATGIGSLNASEGAAWDSSFRGRFAVLSGHPPANSSQVMVTPAALARLGKVVGQTVHLTRPRAGIFTIVGTMRDLTEPDTTQRVFARTGALDGVTPARDLEGTSFYLPDTAVSWPEIQKLNHDGITVYSRAAVLHPPPATSAWDDNANGAFSSLQSILVLSPFAGFSLFEVALLAGAAFMVGTKQQQRSLATLASVGGDRRMLGRVVSSAGVTLGLAGGVIGSAIGIGLGFIYLHSTSQGSLTAFPGFHVDPITVPAIILFAVAAGWISALVPARRASRVDVVASLRGAARPARPSRKAPVVGTLIALVGGAVTVVGTLLVVSAVAAGTRNFTTDQIAISLIVVGPILLQIAALVITPSILRGVARLFTRAGTAARLASRDTARNASRSVPAVGAIMSTIFIASFVITYIAAAQASATAEYEYGTAPGLVKAQFAQFTPSTAQTRQLSIALASTVHVGKPTVLDSGIQPTSTPEKSSTFALPRLNAAARCTQPPSDPTPTKPGSLSITSPDCQGPYFLVNPTDAPHIWVATPSEIGRAIGTPLTPASRAALASGNAVVFYPQYVRDGSLTIDWWTATQLDDTAKMVPGAAPKTISLGAVVQLPPHAVDYDLVISPTTAKTIGLRYAPSEVIAKMPTAPTDLQLDALHEAAQAITGGPFRVLFSYEGGPSVFASTAEWVLLAVSAIITLGAASVAIGLARSEGRRDETVLGSLGAAPRLRSSLGFWTALIITGVGSIGGVLLGTIPAMAVSEALVQPGGRAAVPFSPPWLVLAIAALGLPLLLASGSWLTAGRSRVQYNVRTPIE